MTSLVVPFAEIFSEKVELPIEELFHYAASTVILLLCFRYLCGRHLVEETCFAAFICIPDYRTD